MAHSTVAAIVAVPLSNTSSHSSLSPLQPLSPFEQEEEDRSPVANPVISTTGVSGNITIDTSSLQHDIVAAHEEIERKLEERKREMMMASQQQQQAQPQFQPIQHTPHPPPASSSRTSSAPGSAGNSAASSRRATSSRPSSHRAAATYAAAFAPSTGQQVNVGVATISQQQMMQHNLSVPAATGGVFINTNTSSTSAGTNDALSPPSSSASSPRSHTSTSTTPAPLSRDTLPYHRKRLLSLVDPTTYETLLHETAGQLGLSLSEPHHQSYRWIVESFFLTPLPTGYTRCYDPSNRPYYYRKSDGESSWYHPCLEKFRALVRREMEKVGDGADGLEATTVIPVAAVVDRGFDSSKKLERPREEIKEQDDEDDDDLTSTRNTSPRPSTSAQPAAATVHSRRFLRANAGISSTSSLFLTEQELAAWGDDGSEEEEESEEAEEEDRSEYDNSDNEASPRHHQSKHRSHDHNPSRPHSNRPVSAVLPPTNRTTAQQQQRVRPASSMNPGRGGGSNATSNPQHHHHNHRQPWNSSQPPAFHTWMNPASIADTDAQVMRQGSLIECRPVSAIQTGGRRERPKSAILGMTAAASTTTSTTTGGVHSNRARINIHLREVTTQLSTLRETIKSKLSSTERSLLKLRTDEDGMLRECVRRWEKLEGVMRRRVEEVDEWRRGEGERRRRNGVNHDENNDEHDEDQDIIHLTSTLHHLFTTTLSTITTSLHALHASLRTSSALQSNLHDMIEGLRIHLVRVEKKLKKEKACMDVSMNGGVGQYAAASTQESIPPLPPNLPSLPTLLSTLHHIQSTLHTHSRSVLQQKDSSRQQVLSVAKEVNVFLRSLESNSNQTRREVEHSLVRLHSVLPGLHNDQARVKHELKQQLIPLERCKRTWMMRSEEERENSSAGSGGGDNTHDVDIAGETTSSTELILQALSDELTTLTNIVSHLESELSTIEISISDCIREEKVKEQEVEKEVEKMRLLRKLMAIEKEGVDNEKLGSTAAIMQTRQTHQHQQQQNQIPQARVRMIPTQHDPRYQKQPQQQYQQPSQQQQQYQPGMSYQLSPMSHQQPQQYQQQPAYGVHSSYDSEEYYQQQHFDPYQNQQQYYAGQQYPSHNHQQEAKENHHHQYQQHEQHDHHSHHHEPQQPIRSPHNNKSTAPTLMTSNGKHSRALSGINVYIRANNGMNLAPNTNPQQQGGKPNNNTNNTSHHPPPPLANLSSELRHTRSQLARDQASMTERLRTRKVRKAKVLAGALMKPELLIPNAGRPVFEGVHSTGYDS